MAEPLAGLLRRAGGLKPGVRALVASQARLVVTFARATMEPIPQSILMVGDLHGNWPWVLTRLLPHIDEVRPDLIVQVGDFGYWPRMEWGRTWVRLWTAALAERGLATATFRQYVAAVREWRWWSTSPDRSVTDLVHH